MDIPKQIASRYTRGHLGVFRGSNIPKSGEAVKRLDRLAPTLVHVCGFIWEWTYYNRLNTTSHPSIIPGAFRGGGGFRGSQIQKSWEAVKLLHQLAQNLVHVCGFVGEWTYAKYNSTLNTPGGFRGVLWDHKFKSGNAAKRLDRLAPNLVPVCGFIWEWTYAKNNSPTIPQGDIWGGGLGGKCSQTAGPIGNKLCRCRYNADESGTQVEHIGPMRHQREHFDTGLSRGNFFWFYGGQYFIKSLRNAMISRENKLK